MKLYNHHTPNYTYNLAAQSAQKAYTNLLTIGKKYRVSFNFVIDGITTATYTVKNGTSTVGTKLERITNREVTEFVASSKDLALIIELSAGNYGRLAHIDNLVIEEIFETGEGYRFGFNGQEKDDEVKGSGNHISFSDYGYDTRLARRLRTDPHFYNYPSISSYAAFANNPIINLDPDGKDIVYFNLQGTETHRVKSNTEFKTFIMSGAKAGDPKLSTVGWKEVAMPKIIEERNGEATTSTNYQDNDYVIAARTGYFNQSKNAGVLNLYTEGGNAIPKEAVQAIPDLDPTLVKAVAMQESNLGTTGVTDIMQANVPGDWSAMKAKYGLVKSESTSVTNSLYGGIRLLATKGFKGGITYDPKTGKSTYTFQGWNKAVGSYNGGGTANYQQNVTEMQQNATTPECSDYTDECP